MSGTSATGGYIGPVAPQPPTADAVQSGLQQMVTALSGLPGPLVRPRWQPMPPTQPDVATTWASIGVTMVEADEYPYLRHYGGTPMQPGMPPGYSVMQRHMTLTVVVTFYGPAAEDAAGMMRDGLYVGQNFEPLMSLGLKLRTIHDLARAPEEINRQYVDRVDLRLELRQQVNRTYPIFDLVGADVDLISESVSTSVSVRVPETQYLTDDQGRWIVDDQGRPIPIT
jgi:hypothetical protein